MDLDSGDNKPSATFNFVVKNFTSSVRESGIYSPPCVIRNIPWKLHVKKEGSSPEKTLGIFFHCLAEDTSESDCICHRHWNCSAKVKISILHKQEENSVIEFDHVFHSGSSNWGFPSFISWREVTNPENGFIEKNTVCVRAEVVVSHPVGIKFKTKDDDTKSELLESKNKIQSLEVEVARLKGDLNVEKCNMLHLQKDLANEKSEVQRLKNNVANEKTELEVLKNDVVNEKAELQRLKTDVANEKADTQSKIKILETLVTNMVLQISELKKTKESVTQSQNASSNSSTEDLRSEVRDVLLSLLSPK